MNLNGVPANALAYLGGEQLSHGRSLGVRLAQALQPRRPIDHEPCGLNLSRRISQHPLNGLIIGDWLAEGLALFGVLEGFFVGCLRQANCQRADAYASAVQRRQSLLQSLSFSAEQIL